MLTIVLKELRFGMTLQSFTIKNNYEEMEIFSDNYFYILNFILTLKYEILIIKKLFI